MSLLAAWLLLPVLAAGLALGWGVLVERATGTSLRGVLLAPLGLAAIVVITQLLTAQDATAELAAPAVAAAGLAGLFVGHRRLRRCEDRWPMIAAIAVFGVYAAPVVLSGSATFAGYGQLGDIADHFVIVDAMMTTGRSVSDPTASAYDMAIAAYPTQGYPTGMHTALGALRPLADQDVAWVFQPFLALVMAFTALALLPLVTPVLRYRRSRAVAVTAAALPALAYGYALQGAIKELGVVWVLALLGGLLPWYAAAAPGPRRTIPIVVAAAAAVGVLGVVVAAWLGPLLLVYAWIAARRDGSWHPRAAALEIGAFLLAGALLTIPTLSQLGIYFRVVVDVVTAPGAPQGNLLRPLSIWQALPAWPTDDFRLAPATVTAWMAVAVSGVAAAFGALFVLRRAERHWALCAWLAVSAGGWAYVTRSGSPWADAKALAIVSPAVALVAAIGVLSLLERGMRAEGAMLALMLAAAVLWSLGLQARGASLAPRDRLDELADLRTHVRGPTLHPQFEPFAKHFLRDGRPDSITEPYPGYRAPPLLRAGVHARPLGESYDLDDLAPAYVRRFRTIVVRRGPGSRPPAIYRRISRGRWWELWQRGPTAQHRWIGSVPAGDDPPAGGRANCGAVRALALAAAERGAQLVAAPRPRAVVWLAAKVAPLPPGWSVDPADPRTAVATQPGSVSGAVRIAVAGEYVAWLASSVGSEVSVSIDAHEVGRVRNAIQGRGQFTSLGATTLAAGRHRVTVSRGRGLRPGAEGGSRFIGALLLERVAAPEAPLVTVAPARSRGLCATNVDWVQAVLP